MPSLKYSRFIGRYALVAALAMLGSSSTALAMDTAVVDAEPAPITFPESFRSSDFEKEKRELLESTEGCPSIIDDSKKFAMSFDDYEQAFKTFLTTLPLTEGRILALRLLNFNPTETPHPSRKMIEQNHANIEAHWVAFLNHTKEHGEFKGLRVHDMNLIAEAAWVFESVRHANDVLIYQLLMPAATKIASKIGARQRGHTARKQWGSVLAAHKEKGRTERAARKIQKVRRGHVGRKRARALRAERALATAGAARLEKAENARLHGHDVSLALPTELQEFAARLVGTNEVKQRNLRTLVRNKEITFDEANQIRRALNLDLEEEREALVTEPEALTTDPREDTLSAAGKDALENIRKQAPGMRKGSIMGRKASGQITATEAAVIRAILDIR